MLNDTYWFKRARLSTQAFSLLELLIGTSLLMVVLGGMTVFLLQSSRINLGQQGEIGLHQSRRGAERELTKAVRMAGRGGLAAGRVRPAPANAPFLLPAGAALGVDNNVATGRRIVTGLATSPLVAEGTDILTVRGVFETLFLVDKEALVRSGSGAVTATLQVVGGARQDLAELIELINGAADADPVVIPAAMILVSAADPDVYGVAELDPVNSRVDLGAGTVTLFLHFYETGNPLSDETRPARLYAGLGTNGTFPVEIFNQGAATVGILREYRYYVRIPDATDAVATGAVDNRLSRAELLPGNDLAWVEDPAAPLAGLRVDLASEIADLQVAFGFDTSINGDFASGTGLTRSVTGENDDFLYNFTGETAAVEPWLSVQPWQLRSVEISLVARVAQADPNHNNLEIIRVADRTMPSTANAGAERRHRRSVTRWEIEPRNL
jgi:hypothetical protein